MYNILKIGLPGLKRSAVLWLLAEWLVLYWSRALEGDQRANVNVEKRAPSRHLLINGLRIFRVHAYT